MRRHVRGPGLTCLLTPPCRAGREPPFALIGRWAAAPLPRVPPPHPSAAPSINHRHRDLHRQPVLCANQPSWAAEAHRVSDTRRTPAPPPRTNGAYLPTVWLASCLIRLNCFFILRVCALPPGGRHAPHISLMERSQITALIYGERRGSVFKKTNKPDVQFAGSLS